MLNLIDVSEVCTVSIIIIIIALMMEAVRTFETSVNFNMTTRRYIPENPKLQFPTPCNVVYEYIHPFSSLVFPIISSNRILFT
jgi:hypothetical protein